MQVWIDPARPVGVAVISVIRVPLASVIRCDAGAFLWLARAYGDAGAGADQLNSLCHMQLWRLLVLLGGLSASLTTQADGLSAVQLLREGGCGGTLPPARPLHHDMLLDRAAEQWAAGRSPTAAVGLSGYRAGA